MDKQFHFQRWFENYEDPSCHKEEAPDEPVSCDLCGELAEIECRVEDIETKCVEHLNLCEECKSGYIDEGFSIEEGYDLNEHF